MFRKVLEGLQILAKYLEHEDGWFFGAEHDEIYVYMVKDNEITEKDRKHLEDLGWSPGDDYGVWKRFV